MVKPYSLVAGQLVSCGQKREPPAEFGKLDEEAARDQTNGRPDNVTHLRSKGSAMVELKCGRRLNTAPDLIPLRELNSRPAATSPADHDVTVQQTADPEVPASRPLPLPDLISHLSAKEVTPLSRRRQKFRLHFPQVK
jgi:hypothetical protein